MVLLIHWIVIAILVVVGFISIKLSHLKHRFFIILLILLALFLYSSMALVTSDNNVELSTSEGIFSAFKVYTGWLANGFGNLKTLTGKAFALDWSSTNGTFFDKKRR